VTLPDVVYPVRKGDHNPELRYSLRSLANLAHNRVWLIGHKPSWVTGVQHWDRPQVDGKYLNATKGLVELTREIGASISEPFLLSNDDFYVMRPVEGPFPVFHMGYVKDVIGWYQRMHHMGAYWRGMVDTYNLLVSY
jgi:hypothetical protein